MKNNLLPIAKEGFKHIALALVLLIIFSIFDFDLLGFLSFLALIFFIYVYRNPERMTPHLEQMSVVSPVDGEVISIEELHNSEYAYKLKVNSSYFDVSLLRAPVGGVLEKIKLKHGARLPQATLLSEDINERVELVFVAYDKNKIKISHILKQSFDEIKIDAKEEQNIAQGSRYGLIINGITTIYFPQNFRFSVSVGDRVQASATLMGYYS